METSNPQFIYLVLYRRTLIKGNRQNTNITYLYFNHDLKQPKLRNRLEDAENQPQENITHNYYNIVISKNDIQHIFAALFTHKKLYQMKKLIFRMLIVTVAATVSLLMVQCNKTEDTNSPTQNADYKFVSVAEKEILIEEGTDDIGDIIECIYTCINSMPVGELSESEIATLNYVREEELLAHDVYVSMYELYNVPVFNNISNSEFIHSTAMKAIIEKYELPDPAANHEHGVFVNPGIQELYDALVEQGSASFQDALIVGATIEDVDIWDLIEHLENDVDNQDIIYALEQLYRGSRNHIRAYTAHLTFQGMTYTPQYISQELYDEIVSTSWETGNGFCLCQLGQSDTTEDIRTE